MPYNRAALIRHVAEELDLAPDGQAVEPENAAKIMAVLPGVVGDLDGRGVFGFPNLDMIPDPAFLHLVVIAASRLTGRFGIDQGRAAELTARAQAAELELRKLNALPFSGARARPEYF